MFTDEQTARYEWLHSIQRQFVAERRIAVTLRELTPEFLEGGAREAEGRALLAVASTYDGIPIHCVDISE